MIDRLAIAALLAVPSLVVADPFLALETAHNLNRPMDSVMTPQAAARWESMFTEGRGIATIHNAKCSTINPNVCIADWGWHRRGETQKGQLVIALKDDEINAFYYTEKPRPHGANNALMGQGADGATTVAGMASGFTEANPVLAGASGPVIAATKLAATVAIQKNAGLNYCTAASTSLAGAGWGASAWNLALLVHPAAAIVPVAAGIYLHHKTEPLWQCLPKDLVAVNHH